MSLLLNNLGLWRRTGLLLMLAASVAGFLALIDLLAGPVSSGPSDLLAVKPSDEEVIGLPSATGLVAFGVVALGIVLAIAALVALRRRPSQNRNSSLPVALILAAMVALVVAGVAWACPLRMGSQSREWQAAGIKRTGLWCSRQAW